LRSREAHADMTSAPRHAPMSASVAFQSGFQIL
jgi:hypothetical protein